MTSSSPPRVQRRSKRVRDLQNPPVAVENVSPTTCIPRRSNPTSTSDIPPVLENVSAPTAILHIAGTPPVARHIANALRLDAKVSTATVATVKCSLKYTNVKAHRFTYTSNLKVCVTSTSGHIMKNDIDAAGGGNWDTYDPLDLFDMGVKSIVTDELLYQFIQKEALRSRIVYLWTDSDEEGEVIASELKTICKGANLHILVRRVVFTGLHSQALKDALEIAEGKIGEDDGINQRLCDASYLESIVDLKTRYAFTRFQQKLLQGTLSHKENANWQDYKALATPRNNVKGTVQIYATEHDNVPSWGLCEAAIFELIYNKSMEDGDDGSDSWFIEAFDRKTQTVFRTLPYEAKEIAEYHKTLLETGMDSGTMVAEVTSSVSDPTIVVDTPNVLTTVELYKASFVYLHLGTKETMDTIQVLYNLALVSYPRTSSKGFEGVSLEGILGLIVSNNINNDCTRYAKVLLKYVAEIVPPPEDDDGPHTAICPTGHVHESYHNLRPKEKNMYELIVRRFLACISSPATVNKSKIIAKIGDIQFSAEIILNYENSTFLDVYPDEYKMGANYAVGYTFKPFLNVIAKRGHPTLYNEYDLIEKMSKLGIGTAATMHLHIHKVTQEERRLVDKTSDGRFRPTEFASAVWRAFSAAGIDCITERRVRMQQDMRYIKEGLAVLHQVLPTHMFFWKAKLLRLQQNDLRLLAAIREALRCDDEIVADETDDENQITIGPCKDHPRSRIVLYKRKSSKSREFARKPGYFSHKLGIKCTGFGRGCTSIKVKIPENSVVFSISKTTILCETCSNGSQFITVKIAGVRPASGCVQCGSNFLEAFLKEGTAIKEEGSGTPTTKRRKI